MDLITNSAPIQETVLGMYQSPLEEIFAKFPLFPVAPVVHNQGAQIISDASVERIPASLTHIIDNDDPAFAKNWSLVSGQIESCCGHN